MSDPEGAPGREDVGTVGEEAAKLLSAVTSWAREHAGDGDRIGEWLAQEQEHVGNGPECRWCPICQSIAVLRTTSPELRQHVASLAVVARQIVESFVDQGTGKPATDQPPADRGPTGRGSAPDVERIDLSEDDPWD